MVGRVAVGHELCAVLPRGGGDLGLEVASPLPRHSLARLCVLFFLSIFATRSARWRRPRALALSEKGNEKLN